MNFKSLFGQPVKENNTMSTMSGIAILAAAVIPEVSQDRFEHLMALVEEELILEEISSSERYFINGAKKLVLKSKLPK